MFCYILFFPTTVPRPLLKGDDIFIKAVNFIYKRDNPYNCFPSIHVLDSFLAAVYINREENISYKLKITSSVISFSIILSTLFIKQHYVYDALSAMVLAYIMYYSLNYAAIVEKIRQKPLLRLMNKGTLIGALFHTAFYSFVNVLNFNIFIEVI
ncbi:phosphatase PAP2 family protein [Caloramator sp. Dgby_cultured_2]|uniref:phosphatase PAP2 family protein n=1 Tax=Caloramator sp. Dgby_cultured_2 TaxID=3029174 RepID=UPI00237ED068|nr:phosphatase PAP2 family protein [Caloramator sp. Dgby_cultured_2]WDU83138.1 phosphatase PAP2 family protein [Caloramator sp. Dgby_cultured_2]